MDRLQKYIINNLSMLFLSIFLALYTIASVIFLIKLATYTAIIQLTVWEMAKLYIFVVPELLFFTLPITFFVSAALTIFRLSNDNEIVVLFALGIHPKFILKILLKPALLLSALLFLNFFIIFPHAKVLSKNFISYKKSEAKFNLAASEFGHKFGDWLLYLGKKNDDRTYSDVFLFNKKGEEEILIGAKKASMINEGGILKLKLNDGEGYSYSKEKFSQIDFETMYINDTLTSDLTTYRTPIEYWLSKDRRDKKITKFITNTLLSVFPIISLFLILSISIVHARHQQSKIYLYLLLSILIYYGMTLGLQKVFVFYTIPIIIVSWLAVTYTIYRKAIVERF
ncbi:LptF/LptG family permease [Sulfurimonas sp.]